MGQPPNSNKRESVFYTYIFQHNHNLSCDFSLPLPPLLCPAPLAFCCLHYDEQTGTWENVFLLKSSQNTLHNHRFSFIFCSAHPVQIQNIPCPNLFFLLSNQNASMQACYKSNNKADKVDCFPCKLRLNHCE